MILDSENQRRTILELIARAHRAPAEVPAIEQLRNQILDAELADVDTNTDRDSSALDSIPDGAG